MEPVLQVSREDKHLYHIYAGDALIRANGKAIFPEFNCWPGIRWFEYGVIATLDEDGKEDPNGWIYDDTERQEYHENSVTTIYSDFFAIVLGLAKPEKDGTILEGRVREVLADPAACAAQTD